MDTTTIRVLRAVRGISTADLAQRAGVHRATAYRWETHSKSVSPETAERLMKALLEGDGSGQQGRIEEPLSAA